MSSWINFGFFLLAWTLVPQVLGSALSRTNLPSSSAGLMAAAAMICIAVTVKSTAMPLAVSMEATGQGYQITYYVVSSAPWLQLEAFLMLGLGGLAILVQGLAGNGRLTQATVFGHWTFHIGAGMTIVQALHLMPIDMPRRYIDYPKAFYWWNMTANAGSRLCVAGAILIGGAFLISLARLVLRR